MPQFLSTNYSGLDRLAHMEDFLQNRLESAQRYQLSLNGRGLLTEVYPISGAATAAGTQSATSIANASAVGLRSGDVVTNIVTWLTSEGATLSIAKNCLWDNGGNLLAQSANTSTAFTTTSVAGTIVVNALTATYTVPADGLYYAGFVSVGNIGPKLASASVVTGVGKQIGAGFRQHIRATAQSDAGSLTVLDSATAFWFGVS